MKALIQEKSITEVKEQIELLPKETVRSWEELDELFLSVVKS